MGSEMTKRRVFYSFHYDNDNWRASQVRNIGVVEGNQPASDNDWEAVKRGGDSAIRKWIADQMAVRSCTIVLIGRETAGRHWINYEISESWNEGKGIFGIYIHKLKDVFGRQTGKGSNPFDYVSFTNGGAKLSTVVKTYDPPYIESKDVYAYISNNLSSWIENAISQR